MVKKKRTSHKSRNRTSWFCMMGYTAITLLLSPIEPRSPVFYLIGTYFTAVVAVGLFMMGLMLVAAHHNAKRTLTRMWTFKRGVVGRQHYIRSAILWAALSYTGHHWVAALVALRTVIPVIAVVAVPTYRNYRLNKVKA